jgi:alpha-ketoglutarate-dependent taurine dioxygenase
MISDVRVSPLSPTFGVAVGGVDLSEPIGPEDAAHLRALFFRHRLLVFRDQQLEAEHQTAFMSIINKVIMDPERPIIESAAVPLAERYSWMSNTESGTYGPSSSEYCFHADHMFTPQGALQAISLFAVEMEQPAPTVFANMVNAAAILPGELRARVDTLFVDNLLSFGPDYRTEARCRMSNRLEGAPNSMYPHAVHPVIERHPVTGEEFLDVSEMMTSHVVGWDDEQSDALFEELARYAYRSDNLYRHPWKLHDFVVWDNIALQHKRDSFPGPGKRVLRRVIANPYELASLYAAAEAPEWQPARTYTTSQQQR